MSKQVISAIVLFASFVLTVALLSGCASDKKTEAAKPSTPPPPPATLSQMKEELIGAKAQLDTTTASLNALAKSAGADVQGNYDKFAVELTNMEKQAAVCRSRAEDLKVRTQAYYDTWNKQADVQNPELRRRASQQRAEAEKTYRNIKSEVELMRLSYDPYMSQLNDVRSYLKGNLTPAAIASVSDLVKKVNADGSEVKQHLDAVVAEINSIMAASGEVTAPPAPAAATPAAPAAK